MVDFKTVILLAALVLIPVVHHSFADDSDVDSDTDVDYETDVHIESALVTGETDVNNMTDVDKCKELLKETNLFKMENNDGLTNFKSSFKNLSKNKIDSLFPPQQLKAGPSTNNSVVKNKLTMEYFRELFEHHGLDLRNRPMPKAWCKSRSSKVHSVIPSIRRSESISTDKERLAAACEIFIVTVLFDGVSPRTIDETFEILYHNWSRDTLTYGKNPTLSSNLPYLTGLVSTYGLEINFFIDQFIVVYFSFFQRKVSHLQPGMATLRGTFKSVGQFCEDKGHIIVNNDA